MNGNRRSAVQALGIAGANVLAAAFSPSLALAAWNQQAFDGKETKSILRELGIQDFAESGDLVLELPDFIDNGALVQVQLASKLPETRSLKLFVDKNPFPYIAKFDLSPQVLPHISMRIRVAESSPVRLIARAGGKAYSMVKTVQASTGGCSGGDGAQVAPDEARPMKIRAVLMPMGVADVRVLMPHPMENGLRSDGAGRPIPAHFIRTFSVQLNRKGVLEAQLGRSVSTDPLMALRLADVKPNDTVTFSWEDSRGMKRTDEARVASQS